MSTITNKEKWTTIAAGKTKKQYLRELWEYKELFVFLAWRDILVRYKQTVIGILWAVLRPFLTMVVFTIVFGRIANLPSEGNVPYPLMVFSALLPWQFFAGALQESSNSVVGNANMISKVYFPRIIIPVSSVIVCLVDFLFSFVILIGMLVFYGSPLKLNILLLPFFILLAFIEALGFGLILSSLSVKYRDFRYIVPFIVQFGLYISPVGFSSKMIPQGGWRLLYSLNPMVCVIDGFRWCILGTNSIDVAPLVITIFITSIVIVFGVRYFRKTERVFADII